MIIGNKAGAERNPSGGWTRDHRPQMLRSQVEEAARDLREDISRLTYLRLGADGRTPPAGIPVEDALGTLIQLREEGKIIHIGLSGASPDDLRRALAVTPIAAVENLYNVFDRSSVKVLAGCERLGIAFVPYYPLPDGRFGNLPEVTGPATRLGVSPATLTLAWLLRRSPAMIPIPGTKSIGHLQANFAALEIAPLLTGEEADAITNLAKNNPPSTWQSSGTLPFRATAPPLPHARAQCGRALRPDRSRRPSPVVFLCRDGV